MLWAILACTLASKATARLTLTLNTGVLSGKSCCSGGRCSSPSMPRAPPPPLPRCRLGWRGSPPRSGQSASTRRCVEQPAAGQTSGELIKTLVVQDWFSPWPKMRHLLWGELLPQSARLNTWSTKAVPHQPAGSCYLRSVAKFTWHIWQFPTQVSTKMSLWSVAEQKALSAWFRNAATKSTLA